MIHLTVKLDNNILVSTHSFEDTKVITIGRKRDNDVVISDTSVSGRHAKISAQDNGFLLSDLNSKNGFFVNKKFVTSHWLVENDLVTIGTHTIRFSHEQGVHADYQAEIDEETSDSTVILDSDSYKSMRAESFLHTALNDEKETLTAKIVLLDGTGGAFELTKKLTTIGKDASCDILVKGFFVGKIAVSISKGANGHLLNFVGGFSRPKINSHPLTESVLLKSEDIFQVGNLQMKYVLR